MPLNSVVHAETTQAVLGSDPVSPSSETDSELPFLARHSFYYGSSLIRIRASSTDHAR
jgi:hypothetical protein